MKKESNNNRKKWGVASIVILSIALGFLYRKYLYTTGEVAFSEAEAYGDLHECVALIGSYNLGKIENYLETVSKKKAKYESSGAVIKAVGKAAGNSNLEGGMGEAVEECLPELEKRADYLRRRQGEGW